MADKFILSAFFVRVTRKYIYLIFKDFLNLVEKSKNKIDFFCKKNPSWYNVDWK